MGWQEERERLLAETIAFVQQALGDSLILAVRAKAPVTPEMEAAAQQLRHYHAGPKPVHLPDLRAQLTSLSNALHRMQLPRQNLAGSTSALNA